MKVPRYVIGVDEVGRGALAGPVVVAAVAVPRNFSFPHAPCPLRDSKRLSPAQRDAWNDYLHSCPRLLSAISLSTAATIDKTNISKAANRAAHRAVARLLENPKLAQGNYRIYLDGGLYLKSKQLQATLPAITIPRGDEKILAIKLASIAAKVFRDRMMQRLAKRAQGYCFALHKGYGTTAHFAAIQRYGPLPKVHRLTFLKKCATIPLR